MKNANSHDYARCLQQAAEFLLSRPAFDIDTPDPYSFNYFRFYDKGLFVAAVKAVGSGEKNFDERGINFDVKAPGVHIQISAPRNTVCRLIKPAQYDCDPFLSPDEEKQLGGAA